MNRLSNISKIVLKLILFLVLASQFLQISGKALSLSGPRVIIGASDDDASVAIGVAVKSKWWNDNTFRAYGNFYYRIAHTLYWLNPVKHESRDFSKKQTKEKAHHFYLLMINIFSLFASLYLISGFISKNLMVRLAYLSISIAATTYSEIWARFLLRPHPEIFFSFLVILSTTLMIKHATFPKNRKYFFWSAFSWGACTATKTTSLFFAPAVLLVVLRGFSKAQMQKAFKYLGIVCLGYFSVGFPQNFIIHKTVKTLMSMGKYTQAMTYESFQNWIEIFKSQLHFPLIVTLFFLFVFKEKSRQKISLRISMIFVIPFLLLITRNTVLPHTHYTFAFILIFLLVFSYNFSLSPISNHLKKYTCLLIFLSLVSVRFTSGFVPESLNEAHAVLTPCRAEYLQASKSIKESLDKAHKILADPYTPVDDEGRQDQIRKLWDHKLSEIDSNVGLIVLNSSFHKRYLEGDEPSSYVKTDIPNWREVRQYYQLFAGKDAAEFQQLKFVKVFDKCSIQLWKPLAQAH